MYKSIYKNKQIVVLTNVVAGHSGIGWLGPIGKNIESVYQSTKSAYAHQLNNHCNDIHPYSWFCLRSSTNRRNNKER